MTFTRGKLVSLGVIALIVILDQLSKLWVLATPRFNAMDCLDRTELCGGFDLSPVFDLTMVWNRGISFGTFQSEGVFRWALVAATVLIAIGFLFWLLSSAEKWTAAALTLVVGGAIGNVIDRVRFGAVVDFFDFSGLYFPWVFNVADASITVGAVLLIADQFLLSRPSEGEPHK